MSRLVAIGGGTFEEIDGISRRIVELSGKKVPNVLFIGTALQDSTNPLTSCKKSFKRVCPGCIVKKLSILRTSYTPEEIDELMDWADIIFVGGGNTAFMLEEWKKQGIDERLRRIYREDRAVISGISAGAICWFQEGFTDSAMFEGTEDWQYEWLTPGFGFYQAAFCPHYNIAGRERFDTELRKKNLPGIALEDGTAFVDDEGSYSFICSVDGAEAYCFAEKDGELLKVKMI